MLAPAVQNRSPPSESAGVRNYHIRTERKKEKKRNNALPSRGPRVFALNIRRFVGPPSWKRSDRVGADALPSPPRGCRTPARAPSERSCKRRGPEKSGQNSARREGVFFRTDDTWEQHARRLQTSFCLVERGVAAETGQLVSELRTHAARAKDGVIARVTRPRVEKRRFRGGTRGFSHAKDNHVST